MTQSLIKPRTTCAGGLQTQAESKAASGSRDATCATMVGVTHNQTIMLCASITEWAIRKVSIESAFLRGAILAPAGRPLECNITVF